MLKVLPLYILLFFMSFSMMVPSLCVLALSDAEIETIQDAEEEKNETSDEYEEYARIASSITFSSSEIVKATNTSSYYYIVRPYGHINDINPPPPDGATCSLSYFARANRY